MEGNLKRVRPSDRSRVGRPEIPECACDCYSPFHRASCRPCGSCVLLAQEIEHVSIEYSVRLSGSQNAREHWATRSKRVKAERMGARLRLAAAGNPPPGDWLVVLTRVGPRELDDDNLAGACKGVRDGVADYLGIDDGDKRIKWAYAQARGPYGVRITVANRRRA